VAFGHKESSFALIVVRVLADAPPAKIARARHFFLKSPRLPSQDLIIRYFGLPPCLRQGDFFTFTNPNAKQDTRTKQKSACF
jgi:hypothetical protein